MLSTRTSDNIAEKEQKKSRKRANAIDDLYKLL
jgi:hypothetical protein